MLKFNLQRVLSDPTGEQDRPLVVRRANMRKPANALMLGAAGMQQGGGPTGGLSNNSGFSSGSNAGTAGHLTIGSGPLGALDLQAQGSMNQLGLGPADMPYYMQPLMAMQVRDDDDEGGGMIGVLQLQCRPPANATSLGDVAAQARQACVTHLIPTVSRWCIHAAPPS